MNVGSRIPDPKLPADPAERTRVIVEACLALGFARAGVAAPEPTANPQRLLGWLERGEHGQMRYLTERLESRLDIRAMLPAARSVVMVADQYARRWASEDHETQSVSANGKGTPDPAAAVGLVAKYAQGRDYHRVIKDRLHTLADRLRTFFPGCETRTFVDTGPVLEREHAARAGLGSGDGPAAFIGKHTLLIDPRLGSYLLLGGIITSLDLAPTAKSPEPPAREPDHCGGCTRCIDACPTSAITPYSVNATRCISYLTIEQDGPIDPALHSGIGSWVLGCDICQDVCPYNAAGYISEHHAPRTLSAYAADPVRSGLRLLEMVRWTEADRQRVFGTSAGKRANLDMLRRNALIALANQLGASADTSVRSLLTSISADPAESPTLRTTADQILARWGAASGSA